MMLLLVLVQLRRDREFHGTEMNDKHHLPKTQIHLRSSIRWSFPYYPSASCPIPLKDGFLSNAALASEVYNPPLEERKTLRSSVLE